MTETLVSLLLRRSEAGNPALLWGREAKPFLGREFDRLLHRGILIEQPLAEDWDVCSACECGLDARPIQRVRGQWVAACPYDHRSDLVLDDDDLRSFEIVASIVVRELSDASGFSGEPSEFMPGVWRLGLAKSSRATFLALSASAATAPGLVGAIRLIDRSIPVTMICPEVGAAGLLRFAEADVHVVPLAQCLLVVSGGLGYALDQARLDPASRRTPRLVIRRNPRIMELDGVRASLTDQTLNLLLLLVEQAEVEGSYAAPRDVESRVWGKDVHRVSRPARDVVRELRDIMERGAVDPEAARSLIVNRRDHGWRLSLPAAEIQVVEA